MPWGTKLLISLSLSKGRDGRAVCGPGEKAPPRRNWSFLELASHFGSESVARLGMLSFANQIVSSGIFKKKEIEFELK